MMRPDEKGTYRSDSPARKEPRYEPTKGLDRMVRALVCSVGFAMGLVAGVFLSLFWRAGASPDGDLPGTGS